MLRVIEPATEELFSTDLIKKMLRIDGDEFDDVLPILITAARETVEAQTGVALAVATYEWTPVGNRTRPLPLLPATVTSNEDDYPITLETLPVHIPAALVAAISLLVGENLRTTEAATEDTLTDNPAFKRLVMPYRRMDV